MGFGYLHLPSSQVDVVHTEMCSLHLHPLKHSIDQLIVQSLFADGFIKYSLKAERGEGAAFAIRALQEETIPNTLSSMSWSCEDHGLGMTLSKEVPAQISAALPGFIERLWKKAGVQERGMTLYTVHPGGPKILAQIERLLRLNAEQIRYSHQVLSHYGNMSSATLPHMWDLILADREIPEGTQVISLAFGPGLSISGALFEKTGE
jgi:predicted naringenin-chalcone synthase